MWKAFLKDYVDSRCFRSCWKRWLPTNIDFTNPDTISHTQTSKSTGSISSVDQANSIAQNCPLRDLFSDATFLTAVAYSLECQTLQRVVYGKNRENFGRGVALMLQDTGQGMPVSKITSFRRMIDHLGALSS